MEGTDDAQDLAPVICELADLGRQLALDRSAGLLEVGIPGDNGENVRFDRLREQGQG